MDINKMSPESGRILLEDNSVINKADILADVYDSENHVIKTSATLGDIAIDNVSIKDKTANNYIKVNADGSIDVNATLPAGNNVIGHVIIDSVPEVEIKNDSGNPVPVNGTVSVNALPTGSNTIGNVNLNSGTNHLGKTGYTLKKVSANFTRPADTTAYAIGDAITNSTSSPAVFQLDLGAVGAANGQAVEIRKVAVSSSAKQSTLPLINVYLSPTTFTTTNDNSALDIDDTTMEAGGGWFACDVQNYTASNSRVAKENANCPMLLAAADNKLYGTLQANNAYVPVSEEKFTVIVWVALL